VFASITRKTSVQGAPPRDVGAELDNAAADTAAMQPRI